MKKIAIAFVTVLFIAGLADSSLANGPGWSNDRSHDNRGKLAKPHYKYDHRDGRDHRVPQQRYIQHEPVRPQPVVHVLPPLPPGFSIFLPHLSIQIR